MTPDDWFDALESRLPPDRLVREGHRALVQLCELFRAHLSPRASRALDIAHAYWSGDGSLDRALFDARIAVWKEVDAIAREHGENAAWLSARALVMVLFPPCPPGEFVDAATLFVHFCGQMGIPDERILAALGELPA